MDKVFRVKCLDRDDVESFGFVKLNKNTWAGWNDFVLNEISGDYPYFLKATIHVPRVGDVYKIYVHRSLNDGGEIDKKIKEGESERVYKGRIKNKSELRKLMDMLGINKES